jgi:hypothetical protein
MCPRCRSSDDRRSVDRALSARCPSIRIAYCSGSGSEFFMACLSVSSCIDAQARHRLADRDRRERRPRQPLWAVTLLGAALSAGPDDVELIEKLAEFQMTLGVIADYHVNAEAHTLDIKINPTTPLPTGEAGATGRKTCALGTQDLAAQLTHPWTVRVFINSQAAQVFTCKIDAARAALGPPAPVRASAIIARERFHSRLTKRQR